MSLALVKTHESTMLERLLPLVKAFDLIEVEIGGFESAVELARNARATGARVFFIGNGGSAAIASHMAADWMKTAGLAAMSFNDPAALTCLANDVGFETVFATQLQRHGKRGDLLFAISSSGQSKNITSAVVTAKFLHLDVVTLSGFRADNNLRALGEVNFYVPSSRYGTVEVAHHAVLHSILDEVVRVDPR